MVSREADNDVLLVHGVFGSGKTTFLAVLLVYVVALFEAAPAAHGRPRILVSSTTNVAVDRILQALLGLGFDRFIRVGSAKKISKTVLPYSTHEGGSDTTERRDLEEMMRENLSIEERRCVSESLRKLKENRDRLKDAPIVGATCAATTFQSLDGAVFPLVVLDEAGQMTEPTSLLPIARFGCRKLVLVGDPQQLRPTVAGPECAHTHGLDQPMFERLAAQGVEPIMLRRQYRCHPAISAVSNTLFYGLRLVDGIDAAQRPPLVPGLPPLCFVDVPDGRAHRAGGGSSGSGPDTNGGGGGGSGGSLGNRTEAAVVGAIVQRLLAAGIPAGDIGVITLFRFQASLLRQLVADRWVLVCMLCAGTAVDLFSPGLRKSTGSCRSAQWMRFRAARSPSWCCRACCPTRLRFLARRNAPT
jgi:hypothetical protein